MPLVVPYTTEGGPAHPGKHHYLNRWWEVLQPMNNSEVLQGQCHKIETPIFRFANLFVDVKARRRTVLENKGDFNFDEYRIIVRLGPEYLTLATADNVKTLSKDWAVLTEIANKHKHISNQAAMIEAIVDEVLERVAAQAAGSAAEAPRFVALARAIQALTTYADVKDRFLSATKETGTLSAYTTFELELLQGRATRLRDRDLASAPRPPGTAAPVESATDALGQLAVASSSSSTAPAATSSATAATVGEGIVTGTVDAPPAHANAFVELQLSTVVDYIRHLTQAESLHELYGVLLEQAAFVGTTLPTGAAGDPADATPEEPPLVPAQSLPPPPAPPPPPFFVPVYVPIKITKRPEDKVWELRCAGPSRIALVRRLIAVGMREEETSDGVGRANVTAQKTGPSAPDWGALAREIQQKLDKRRESLQGTD